MIIFFTLFIDAKEGKQRSKSISQERLNDSSPYQKEKGEKIQMNNMFKIRGTLKFHTQTKEREKYRFMCEVIDFTSEGEEKRG